MAFVSTYPTQDELISNDGREFKLDVVVNHQSFLNQASPVMPLSITNGVNISLICTNNSIKELTPKLKATVATEKLRKIADYGKRGYIFFERPTD